MQREGFEVNAKRVARIRREEGLEVSKRQRRMRRLGLSRAERQRAERPHRGFRATQLPIDRAGAAVSPPLLRPAPPVC